MGILSSVRSLISPDLAIDLGTASTLVYARGLGVVCNEPSVVAIKSEPGTGKRKIVAVGAEAKAMVGRTPGSISAVRPLREGVIIDFDTTEALLKTLMRRIQGGRALLRPRIIVCVPHGLTEVERRAARESVTAAGAREVFLIEEPIAAAVGAGLPVDEPRGNMVLDIGGGTTEIAVMAMNGIVYSKSLRCGGDKLDSSVAAVVRRKLGVLIGERTAERLKIAIGSVIPTGQNLAMEVQGRDIVHGLPRMVTVTERDVSEALSESLGQMVEMVVTALEKTPPELSADIFERGVTFTGGGSLLRGLPEYISREVGLRVRVVEDPLSSVVTGAGKILENIDSYRQLLIQ